jgi:hypothetical protein
VGFYCTELHQALLQAEVAALQEGGRSAAAAAAEEARLLRQQLQEVEAALYNTGFTLHTLQVAASPACGAWLRVRLQNQN